MAEKVKVVAYTVHHDVVRGRNPWDDVPAYDERRFQIVSAETGEVLDDAQGYGYKTMQKAYAAWAYKTRDKTKDKEKKEKDRTVRKWMREHPREAHALEEYAFEIEYKHSWGPDDHFDAAFVEEQLKEWGFTDLPFTGKEYLYSFSHKPLK